MYNNQHNKTLHSSVLDKTEHTFGTGNLQAVQARFSNEPGLKKK